MWCTIIPPLSVFPTLALTCGTDAPAATGSRARQSPLIRRVPQSGRLVGPWRTSVCDWSCGANLKSHYIYIYLGASKDSWIYCTTAAILCLGNQPRRIVLGVKAGGIETSTWWHKQLYAAPWPVCYVTRRIPS